jgi:hypothetical protein
MEFSWLAGGFSEYPAKRLLDNTSEYNDNLHGIQDSMSVRVKFGVYMFEHAFSVVLYYLLLYANTINKLNNRYIYYY